MKSINIRALLIVIMLAVTACTNKSSNVPSAEDKQGKAKSNTHNAGTASIEQATKTPVTDAIKKQKLKEYPQKTIGEAFDAYNKAVSKEWQEVPGKDGKFFVDYVCWLNESAVSAERRKEGVVRIGLDVKFVVQNSGDFFVAMVSRLQMRADGQTLAEPVEPAVSKRVMDAIYGNKELSFL